jgi:hypothetical protein
VFVSKGFPAASTRTGSRWLAKRTRDRECECGGRSALTISSSESSSGSTAADSGAAPPPAPESAAAVAAGAAAAANASGLARYSLIFWFECIGQFIDHSEMGQYAGSGQSLRDFVRIASVRGSRNFQCEYI